MPVLKTPKTKLLQTEEPYNSFPEATGFQNRHFVLPEDGTLISKHVGDAHLMFVIIKTYLSTFYFSTMMHTIIKSQEY
jgi:hypothetical protein